jgi:hypothetical protein
MKFDDIIKTYVKDEYREEFDQALEEAQGDLKALPEILKRKAKPVTEKSGDSTEHKNVFVFLFFGILAMAAGCGLLLQNAGMLSSHNTPVRRVFVSFCFAALLNGFLSVGFCFFVTHSLPYLFTFQAIVMFLLTSAIYKLLTSLHPDSPG